MIFIDIIMLHLRHFDVRITRVDLCCVVFCFRWETTEQFEWQRQYM